jgi:hypothetical protein
LRGLATRLMTAVGMTGRTASSVFRAALRGKGESDTHKLAAAQLRREVAQLPPVDTGAIPAEAFWTAYRTQLRMDIARKDPRHFLRWPLIEGSMVARREWIERALPEMASIGWLPLLTEDDLGSPQLIRGTKTSPNLLQKAYQLVRFQRATGRRVADFAVTEFGSGYGAMAKVLHRLGVQSLRLYDLPEFSALQRYYLSLLGIEAETISPPVALPHGGPGAMLIATWSLSETPLALRAEMQDAIMSYDAFLIGFKEQLFEIDNVSYFKTLMKNMPGITWTQEHIYSLPGDHRYLFGVRE